MTGWSYVRGDHPAIIQGSTCVAFGGDHGEDRARAVLPMMTADTSLEDLLDVVLQTGIGALPDFFVGRIEDGTLTAMLRGAAVLTIEDDRWRRSTVDGLGARTWREVAFDGVTRLAVCFDRQLVRADLRTTPDDERTARPGALAISEIVFRRPDAPLRLMTVTHAARGGLSAETEDFPAHLFDDGSSASSPTEQPATVAQHSAAPAPTSAGDPEPTSPPRSQEESETDRYRFDDLFGSTRFFGVEAAAVRAEEVEDEVASSPAAILPTPSSTARGHAMSPAASDEMSAEVSGLVCATGHPNPPTRATCVVCAIPLTGAQPARTSRPQGMLRLPDGRRLPIDAQMIIGRSPRAERSDGRALPTLVKIDRASSDVSRNHARIGVEGWNVVIEDLGSTNGTVILATDGTIRRLRGGETALLTAGVVVDLGGVRIHVEDVP